MATKTWSAAADGSASTGTNWSPVNAPAAGDDVVFDATSTKNCTWDITTNLNTVSVASGYSGTITQIDTLNCTNTTGSFTFDGGTWNSNNQSVNIKSLDASGSATKTITAGSSVWSIAGNFDMSGSSLTFNKNTSEILITATGSLNIGNLSLNKLSFQNAITTTITGSVVCTGTIDLQKNIANSVINGGTLDAQGDCTQSGTGGSQTGDTILQFSGAENQAWTQTYADTVYSLGLPVVINKSGNTLTISGTINHSGNLTYTGGTVSTVASTYVSMRTKNLNSSGISWNNVTLSANNAVNGTTTLTSNLDVNGNLTIDANQTLSASSYQINLAGNWTNNGTFTRGTSTVVFDG